MIEHIVKSEEDKLYRSPSTKVIPINVGGVLCYSEGNERLYEEDLGDGGFH